MATKGRSEARQRSIVRMAEQDPELAGRLFVAALPAAAATISGVLRYRLELEQVGVYDVAIEHGDVKVAELERFGRPSSNGIADGEQPTAEQPTVAQGVALVPANRSYDFVLRTDPLTLARLSTGASALKAMIGGGLRIRGKRRRALRLRQMSSNLSMRDIARAGVQPDPDLVYRSLPYVIDPQWTVGHKFCIAYNLEGDESGPGGSWYLVVDDGNVSIRTEPPPSAVDSTITLARVTWGAIVRGELIPGDAMRQQLSRVEGRMYPVTLFGRWVERSEGRDDAELAREVRQREVQDRRATWGSRLKGGSSGQGDPAVEEPKAKGVALLSYEELYALWERQNWKAHEIDFTVDKQHWLATTTDGQQDTIWSLASFYIGEERVAADLAPFVLAAPSGEAEIFLATQLVDEARHAAFFDRFMAEVMALEPEDIRSRLTTLEQGMTPAWKQLFDGDLRGIARRIQAEPGNLDLMVEGIVIYHLVIEGVLAMTGQHQILKYLENHDLYPGFCQGFSLVEKDEHRHIAFGVKFLADAVSKEPRYKDLIERKVADLVPRASHVFVPPHAQDPGDFTSYDYHSSEIYGFAYRALKRRMNVIGVDVPPAEDLMPGPIDQPVVA